MTKVFIEQFIRNMKLAGIVSKATPWTYEGFGDKQKNIRYVGLALKDDWLEIFSEHDNVLLKFISDRESAYLEFYLANKPPFLKFSGTFLSESQKWEIVLGELKRKLKKDKNDFIRHEDSIDNIYSRIKPHLK